jgi:dynein heavy chain, axonemal
VQLRLAHTELAPVAQSIVSEFNIKHEDWMHGSFIKLDAAYIEESVTEWCKKMMKLSKSLPRDDLRSVAEVLRVKLEEFRTFLPLISCICNPGMRGRHWQAISEVAGFKVTPSEDESLHALLHKGLLMYDTQLQELSDSASREHALERQLDKMQADWVGVVFELAPWKHTGGCILKGASVEEVQQQLDDHAIKSQAMMSSPFAVPFHDRISSWTAKLSKMQSIFDEWLTCQVKWMYLGPVYGSEEIAKQMPKERKEFAIVDSKFRRIMAATEKNPDVLAICGMDGLLEDLADANKVCS